MNDIRIIAEDITFCRKTIGFDVRDIEANVPLSAVAGSQIGRIRHV